MDCQPLPPVDLKEALADVRRAYRLAAAYQRRVYDIVNVFVAAFPDRQYYWWQPNAYNKPGSANPFLRWSWDMLPMVRTSFLFLPAGADPNAPGTDQWMLELLLDTDSGFEAPLRGEPDPTKFPEPDHCRTTLRAIAWRPTQATRLNWLHGLWNPAEWPDVDDEVRESSEPPLRAVAKTFELHSLAEKQTVLTAASEFNAVASPGLGLVLR